MLVANVPGVRSNLGARHAPATVLINLEQLKLSVMFSVTAPGAHLYPFDHRFCFRIRPVKDALDRCGDAAMPPDRVRLGTTPPTGRPANLA